MSIVESLKRLFDPATYNYEKAEKQGERRLRLQVKDGDPPDFEVPDAAAKGVAPERKYRCRLCRYTAKSGAYCPECLAETMELSAPETDP